jgi:hypothetical protein
VLHTKETMAAAGVHDVSARPCREETMADRKLVIGGCILAVVIVVAVVIAARNRTQASRAAAARPPEFVGRQVPDATFEIDFAKRYDFHCFTAGDHGVVLRGCKILGFTGAGTAGRRLSPPVDEELALAAGYPGRWLVLERPDGRRAYVLPESVRLIEESGKEP